MYRRNADKQARAKIVANKEQILALSDVGRTSSEIVESLNLGVSWQTVASYLGRWKKNREIITYHASPYLFDKFEPTISEECGVHFGSKSAAEKRIIDRYHINSFFGKFDQVSSHSLYGRIELFGDPIFRRQYEGGPSCTGCSECGRAVGSIEEGHVPSGQACEEAAADRKLFNNMKDLLRTTEPTMYKVKLNLQNSLRMWEDTGGGEIGWSPQKILSNLFDPSSPQFVPMATPEETEAYNNIILSATTLNVTANNNLLCELIYSFLLSKGYDSIIYSNTVEGGGDSYAIFDLTQVEILERIPINRELILGEFGDEDGPFPELAIALYKGEM